MTKRKGRNPRKRGAPRKTATQNACSNVFDFRSHRFKRCLYSTPPIHFGKLRLRAWAKVAPISFWSPFGASTEEETVEGYRQRIANRLT